MESLQSGSYTIKSKSINGAYIGRHIIEDKSLLPKRVLLLPEDFPGECPKWEITKSDGNTYILKTRGSHVAEIRGLLFGVLLPQPPPTEWKIEAQPQHGKDLYTISTSHGWGWVSPDGEYQQVAIRPLVVGPREPPYYPRNELFEITSSY